MTTAPVPHAPDLALWQGEPPSVWAARWGIPAFEAWSILSSTNDRARALARAEAPAWTVIVADRQGAGRGRSGRPWQSESGAGLWVSVVLHRRPGAGTGLLPLLAGLALARALEREGAGQGAGPAVGLKWPNDVWVEGRKVAGILCETAGQGVVVGIGVNLRPPAGGFVGPHAGTAGALEPLWGRAWSEGPLLGVLLDELRRLWEPGPLRFVGPLARAWAERDILRGRDVRVGAVEGVARGVAPDGALVVERSDGSRVPVRAGTVQWRGGAADGGSS